MKERPILFSGPMVRAIIDGRKTQTRRIVNTDGLDCLGPCGDRLLGSCYMVGRDHPGNSVIIECPFGQPGDRLWVRETWRSWDEEQRIIYKADYQPLEVKMRWKPPACMPRWASRLTLEITAVRVERLQGISEEDAVKEGADRGLWDQSTMTLSSPADESDESYATHKAGFAFLWESIHGPGSWDANPWVFVIEFRKVEEAE